jgi:SAM-dependent methyltransferase
MTSSDRSPPTATHLTITDPSPWVRRFAPLIRQGGGVLDVACGGGRHARYLLGRGHGVTMLDRDIAPVLNLAGNPRAEVIQADLETGDPLPVEGRSFAAIVVVNYLFRPLIPRLVGHLDDGGLLIYETFARGNERFNRPRNPDHLLKSGELLEAVRGKLRVIAYEHGIVDDGFLPGVKQRICAVNASPAPDRDDGEPEPLRLFSP